MIVTVLWEDSRGVVRKGFGAQELLVACVAERLGIDRFRLGKTISSKPLKGAGNVIRELCERLPVLSSQGPVFAVLDRDKACEIWKPAVADCRTTIRARIAEDVDGDFDLVFLEQNMESLIHACDPAALTRLGDKPSPDARDRVLEKAASESPTTPRQAVLANCPSFARLVHRVAAKVDSAPRNP